MKLRLLKVITQAVFVVDDGENLTEQAAEPVTVPAAEWPHYPMGRFADDVERIRQQVEGPDEGMGELVELPGEAVGQ